VLSEAVLVINEVVIVIEKSTAQIDYEHDYDYAHDSQNSVSYLSGIRDTLLIYCGGQRQRENKKEPRAETRRRCRVMTTEIKVLPCSSSANSAPLREIFRLLL
jgi:hypothetical protein